MPRPIIPIHIPKAMKIIKFNNVQVGAEFMDMQGFRSRKISPQCVYTEINETETVSFAYNAISIKKNDLGIRELRYYHHDTKVCVNNV